VITCDLTEGMHSNFITNIELDTTDNFAGTIPPVENLRNESESFTAKLKNKGGNFTVNIPLDVTVPVLVAELTIEGPENVESVKITIPQEDGDDEIYVVRP
ncbi:unnamed protein product, partial [Owenia fusiformis]